jgi:hypothetical protein
MMKLYDEVMDGAKSHLRSPDGRSPGSCDDGTTAEELRPMADDEDHRKRSFAERARLAWSNVEQDDRFKQAAAATQDVASRAQEASKSVTRKVSQQDAWDELRGDVELLTEIARAHHALITDLIDRVAELEGRAGTGPGAGHGG